MYYYIVKKCLDCKSLCEKMAYFEGIITCLFSGLDDYYIIGVTLFEGILAH